MRITRWVVAAALCVALLVARVEADEKDDEIARRLDDAARRVREKKWPDGMIEFLRECRETNHMALCTMMGDLVVKGDEAKQKKEGLPRTTLPWQFWDEYAICQYYIGRKEQAFDAIETALGDPTLPESSRFRLHDNRHYPISHIKSRFATYNETLVKELVGLVKKPDDSVDVCMTMTTCKRVDLFKNAMDSFINACSDVKDIGRFIVVDDNSSPEARQEMKTRYPFVEFVMKPSSEKGHAQSLNILKTKYWPKCKYIIHLEDDYLFFARKAYVRQLRKILDADQSLGQVLFSKNYAEVPSQWMTAGGEIRQIPDVDVRDGAAKITYFVHQFFREGSAEYNAFVDKIGRELNFAHWPHFSLRPSMIRSSSMKDLPAFITDIESRVSKGDVPADRVLRGHTGFEVWFAFEYAEKGWKTAFLDGINAVTTGKTVFDETTQDGSNAYELNGLPQLFRVETPKQNKHEDL